MVAPFRRPVSLATWKVPIKLSRLGLYLIFGFIVLGFALLDDFPIKAIPTEAIGLLAAGAVIVAVRTEYLTRSESIGWILVAFFLFFVEMHVLSNDRAEQQAAFDEARVEETLSFKRALLDNQQKFETTMKRSDAITEGLTKAINLETGGDDYVTLGLGEVMGPIPMNVQILGVGKHNVMLAHALPVLNGGYPLQGVHISVSGPLESVNIDCGTMYPGRVGGVESPRLVFRPDSKKASFSIWISALNGVHFQEVLFLKVKDRWEWSTRFYKGGGLNKKFMNGWSSKWFPADYTYSQWYKAD